MTPEIKTYLRRYTFWACVLFAALIVGLNLKQNVDAVQNQRAACERGNVSRPAQLHLLNDLVTINRRRVRAASSHAEAEANRYALHRYQADRRLFVGSQAAVAVESGSVVVDCSQAYPLPFPLG